MATLFELRELTLNEKGYPNKQELRGINDEKKLAIRKVSSIESS